MATNSNAGNIVKRGIYNLAPAVPLNAAIHYAAPAPAIVPAVVPAPISYASVTKVAYPSYPIYKSYYAPAPLLTKVVYPQPVIHAAPIIKYRQPLLHYHYH